MIGTPVPAAPKMTAPRFGAWLKAQRAERSLERIATRVRNIVEDSGLQVDRSSIDKCEKGRIPSWPLLYAFAQVYEVGIAQISSRLLDAIQTHDGRDLIRHKRDQRSAPIGGADVPASVSVNARVLELESQLREFEDLKARFGEVQDVARRLFAIVAPDEEGRATGRGKTGSGRTTGKTG
jgi:hypothetical protein